MSHKFFSAATALLFTFSLSAQSAALNNDHDWQELGKCPFTNDIISSAEPQSYHVTVQADIANKGIYRIVDVWQDYPEGEKDRLIDLGFLFYNGEDSYIILDTRDPKYVRILPSPVGLSDAEGDYTICTPSEIIGQYTGVDDAYAKDKAGKFENGVITFTKPSAIFLRQGNWFTRTNNQGATRLDISEFIAGINDISIDENATTVYFNTMGIRVAHPDKGIYICRKGSKNNKDN